MNNKETKLTQLDDFLSLLENELPSPGFSDISDNIGFDIPNTICNLVNHSELINREYSDFFSGYEIHSADQIVNIYNNRTQKMSFFGEYDMRDNFDLIDDVIDLFNANDPDDSEPESISNIARFFPIAEHKGDYLVADLKSESGDSLVEVMMGYSANVYSISVREHIKSLINGLVADLLVVDEDGFLDFPVFWHDRTTLLRT